MPKPIPAKPNHTADSARAPRILLAVHSYGNGYVHLPAHLAEAGFEVDLIARPGNPLLASRSLGRRWSVAGSETAFAAAVTERLGDPATPYDAFQLVDEPALLAFFSTPPDPRIYVHLPFNHPTLLGGVGQKHSFHAWCDESGLPTPHTLHADDWAGVTRAVPRLGLPCYLKGSTGSGGTTVRRLETPADLDAAQSDLARSGPWLVQEKICGPTGGVQFAAHRGRLLGWLAFYKRVTLADGHGPTVVGEFCSPAGMEAICARACAAGGLNGLHGFDFMLGPDGRPRLIDPHLGRCTTMKHFGTQVGVDLAAAWRDALLGRTGPVQRPKSTGGAFTKFPEIVEFYCEQGPLRAARELRPWRGRARIGYGRAREWRSISRALAKILTVRARIQAGALRQRWLG